MEKNLEKGKNIIVKSMFFSLLITMMISALGIAFAGFIDGICVSHYYGDTAMASYSLCGPIFKLFGVFTGVVASGLQIVLSKILGKGNTKRANQLFTFFFVLCFVVGGVLLVIGECLAPQLAFIFGATDFNSDLNKMASEYIRGISVGLPFLFLYSAMLPLYSFDGAKRLVKICALVNAGIDILFNILNGEFFNMGMFGMGLATTAGYIVAAIPMIAYLFAKKHGLKLDFKSFSFKGTKQVFVYGLPQATRRVSTVIKGIVSNFVITTIGGSIALTASGVEGNLFGLLSVLTSSVPGVVISLGSIYLLDRDDKSMKHLLKAASYYVSIFVGVITILVIALAPLIVKMYNLQDATAIKESTNALMIGILGLPLATVNTTYMAYLQIVKKMKWTHIFTVIDYCLSYVICYAIFAPTCGTLGLWITIPAAEILNFIIAYIYSCIATKKFRSPFKALYPLENDFEDSESKSLQFNIKTKEELPEYISQATQFIKNNTNNVSAIEDTKRIIEQLFMIYHPLTKQNGKLKFNMDILITTKNNRVTVRIRDDNKNNNPINRAKRIEERREEALHNKDVFIIVDKIKDIECVDVLNIHNCVFTLS